MITDIQLLCTLFAFVAIPSLYYVWFKNETYHGFERFLITIIFVPLLSIFGSGIILFNLRFLDSETTETYKPTCHIASFKNTQVINGKFTLGCGVVEQKEYYFYFYKTLNGGYARGKKDISNTVIVEDDTQKPHIETLTTTYKSKSGWFKFSEQSEKDFKIIVPKGTIVNKFELY